MNKKINNNKIIYQEHEVAKMKYYIVLYAIYAFKASLQIFNAMLKIILQINNFPVVGLQEHLTLAIEDMDYI